MGTAREEVSGNSTGTCLQTPRRRSSGCLAKYTRLELTQCFFAAHYFKTDFGMWVKTIVDNDNFEQRKSMHEPRRSVHCEARGLQGQGIWRIVSARKTSNQPTAKQDSQKQRFDMETATRFKGGCQGEPSNLGGQWEQSNKLGLGVACKTSLCQLVPSFNTNLQDANCTCTRSVNKECSGRPSTHLCTHSH